jgi:hypothetical protein
MVKRHFNPDKQTLKNENIITLPTDIEREKATHNPNLTQSHKSQFSIDLRLRTITF